MTPKAYHAWSILLCLPKFISNVGCDSGNSRRAQQFRQRHSALSLYKNTQKKMHGKA